MKLMSKREIEQHAPIAGVTFEARGKIWTIALDEGCCLPDSTWLRLNLSLDSFESTNRLDLYVELDNLRLAHEAGDIDWLVQKLARFAEGVDFKDGAELRVA